MTINLSLKAMIEKGLFKDMHVCIIYEHNDVIC